ncbi:MAG TPA: ABC-2 family transporter protein [Symbiobacteriaceae bacterium]|jgi:ABC-2 type transport system permease protein
MSKRWLKYLEVARVAVRSRVAYLWDQLLSNVTLVIIMFVFVQLWKVTYAYGNVDAFAGYSLPEMIWYLVATEAIVMSMPRIHATLEQEVKDGDLALRLNKPYNYLLFHYSQFIGEGLFKLATVLALGGLTAYLLVGGFAFYWPALPVFLLLWVTTQTVNFFYSASVGLLAFWMEEVSGVYLLFDRFKWILGGMLLPLEIYPPAVRRVAEVLPFRYMIAGPARLFVKFTWDGVWQLLGPQLVWGLAFGAVCTAIYRLGVRRVDVNGG